MRGFLRSGVTVALCAAICAACAASRAAEVRWAVGPAFEKQLQSQVGVTWAKNPIRAALARLAENQEVAIFLDRRVDPELKVDFSAQNVAFHELLDKLGRQQSWGVSYLGSVVYLGPTPTARKLATLSELRLNQCAGLSAAARQKYVATTALKWDELTTPRELTERVATEAGIRLVSADRIPHDLWPAGSWPPSSTIDKLTLILAGFDLTFEIAPDGSAIRPIPLPERVAVSRKLGTPANAEQIAKQLADKFPNVKFAAQPGQLAGEGIVEDLDAIQRLLRGEAVRQPAPMARPGAKQVFKLTVENKPAGGILKALATQIGLEIEFDPSIPPEKLAQLVSFQVADASLEELLQAVASPAGLRCEVNGKKVKVVEK